jgi:hypothetical protein
MKKLTKKDTTTFLTGVQMTGKEFVQMLKDNSNDGWDVYEWTLPFKDKDGDNIVVNSQDHITIEGSVTIMFNTDSFEENGVELPKV